MTKLVENYPQGTANIADDRVLAPVKLWSVNCESRFYIYRSWIVEANNKEEAWTAFLKKKGGATQGFKDIIIIPAHPEAKLNGC